MPPKGELETFYGSPWGGVDYSRPYNVLDPQFLAPGSVNTSQHSGFLTSSPWVGSLPATPFSDREFVIGIFKASITFPDGGGFHSGSFLATRLIVVTNIGVYYSGVGLYIGSYQPPALTLLYTWDSVLGPPQLNTDYLVPGNSVSFVQVGQTVYFTGLALGGIFQVSTLYAPTFAVSTTYVAAANLFELDGYLVAAQCIFPTGGGTGTTVLPTVAWSGPGEYAGSGASDPWNPVNGLGGGFNELADVPDQISGVANIGRSALLFRNGGVSQMDPNPGTSNSGIQPFTFYHLWASEQGVGAFQGTVAQFGQQVLFRSSDNVYSISISGGLQTLGARIIAKINYDWETGSRQAVYAQFPVFFTPWYYASIVTIDGQLHYLLTFSNVFMGIPASSNIILSTCLVYDFNLSENAWHLWDMSQYVQQGGGGQAFLGFSCPILQASNSALWEPNSMSSQTVLSQPNFDVFGAFTQYIFPGTSNPPQFIPAGNIFSMVPFNYDYATNPTQGYTSTLFVPLSLPVTNIVMRGEVISLGHKISNRRLRVQADNAPLPTVVNGAQQQALATFTGALEGNTKSSPLAWTPRSGQTVAYMQGNYPAQGLPIQTYYGDASLSDEMVQPSLSAIIADPTNPWLSLPAFRIATMSLIQNDTKGTTQ